MFVPNYLDAIIKKNVSNEKCCLNDHGSGTCTLDALIHFHEEKLGCLALQGDAFFNIEE